jgi:pimeloyl-ACP methyl ester carboxylesterase
MTARRNNNGWTRTNTIDANRWKEFERGGVTVAMRLIQHNDHFCGPVWEDALPSVSERTGKIPDALDDAMQLRVWGRRPARRDPRPQRRFLALDAGPDAIERMRRHGASQFYKKPEGLAARTGRYRTPYLLGAVTAMTTRATRGLSLALVTLGAYVFCTAPSPAAPLKAAPCRIGQSRAGAICGTFSVFEDRSSRVGRTIALRFIVIKAKHPIHRAITFNPGGPGVSSTASAADFADATTGAIAALRDRYDILLVDNRGTGGSAPQLCDFAPAAHPELYFRQVWPDALVRSCRHRLASHANLSLYSTSVAADDLDDVRAALGYPKLVLDGGSYGTRFFLDYARRHPQRVESIVLEGVAPPHYYIIPLPMARGAQTAMDRLEAACRSDATCASHFPNFSEHFAAVVHRFDAKPVTITVQNTVTHKTQRVQLSKEVLVESIRHALYFPSDAAYIPVAIERAYTGDYTQLGQMVDQLAQLFSTVQANGLNLSVSCGEDIPFITEQAVERDSAGTFEGDARVHAQQRACLLWNVTPVSPQFIAPVKSNAPILIISAGDDPATPPSYARSAVRYLPNARIMLIAGASHDSDYPPCVDTTIVEFVRAASASGLDLRRCAAKYHRPAFVTRTYDEPAPNEDAGQSKRFRAILALLLNGRIDRSQLTPALSKQLSEDVVRGFAAGISTLGPLQHIAYKGTVHSPKSTVYKYLLRFARGDLVGTFTLDSANLIQDIDFSATSGV